MTTIGVAISVYNGAATITQALASVAGQTQPPDAVVVVDDGSTDATLANVEAWRDLLPLVVVRKEINGGVAAGRMSAMAQLDTDLVLALDADDVWLPEHLARLLAAYDARPGIVSPMAVAWKAGGPDHVAWDQRLWPLPRRLDTRHLLPMNWLFSGSLFERAAFDAAGGYYRFPGCEDWDLWLRMLAADVPVSMLDEPTVLYRMHDASLSANDKGLPTEVQVLEAFLRETSDPKLRSAARRSLRHRRARMALRRAYDHARSGRGCDARLAAVRTLTGPASVRLRGAALVLSPGRTVRRRDRAHRPRAT